MCQYVIPKRDTEESTGSGCSTSFRLNASGLQPLRKPLLASGTFTGSITPLLPVSKQRFGRHLTGLIGLGL